MTGELAPRPETRVSDDKRDQVIERLNQAVGEGRLTLVAYEIGLVPRGNRGGP